jgi:hypothetical protein
MAGEERRHVLWCNISRGEVVDEIFFI